LVKVVVEVDSAAVLERCREWIWNTRFQRVPLLTVSECLKLQTPEDGKLLIPDAMRYRLSTAMRMPHAPLASVAA